MKNEPSWDWGAEGAIGPPFKAAVFMGPKRNPKHHTVSQHDYLAARLSFERSAHVVVFAKRGYSAGAVNAPWWVLRMPYPLDTPEEELLRMAQVWLDVVKLKWDSGRVYDDVGA